jgi:hypothetical protein
MNIHYEDGLNDATTYRGFLPPPPQTRNGNVDFSQYNAYAEGFNEGSRQVQIEKAVERELKRART